MKSKKHYQINYIVFKLMMGLATGFGLVWLIKDFSIGRLSYITGMFIFIFIANKYVKRGTEYILNKNKKEPVGFIERTFFGG